MLNVSIKHKLIWQRQPNAINDDVGISCASNRPSDVLRTFLPRATFPHLCEI